MINTEEFTKRLQRVIDFYGESSSSFAEKIGVQRSNISHILSGRNKPSLDFILKVLSTFPEVELYWLLKGKGNFPPENNVARPEGSQFVQKHSLEDTISTSHKVIERIVIFYTDGSFQSFDQSN